VLRQLIDARLLTSYEVQAEDEAPTRSVEIIHESLLANWPRMVRWQTQDQEGAQLRDELRQSARSWDEHGRHEDRLWSGTAFREYQLWRERYPGGLTETEEAFGDAMTMLAGRRRRRRRIAVTAVIAVLLGGLAVVGSFWQRSVREARRAEAATLLSQAQVELGAYPSAAVAYATASLELSDSPEARRLALEALWKGPTCFVIDEGPSYNIAFTPDGRWLVQETDTRPRERRVIDAGGGSEQLETVHDRPVGMKTSLDSGVFAIVPAGGAKPGALWSLPEKRLLATGDFEFPDATYATYYDLSRRRVLLILHEDDRFFVDALDFDGTSERLGSLPFDLRSAARCTNAPNGEWFAVANREGVYVIEIGDHDLSQPRRLEHIEGPVERLECDPRGRFVAARFEDGQIRLWDLVGESPPSMIQGPSGIDRVRITIDGSFIAVTGSANREREIWIWSYEDDGPTLLRRQNLGKSGGVGNWRLNPIERQIVSIVNPDPNIRLWPLRAPADAEPMIMQQGDSGAPRRVAIHPSGEWLAVSGTTGLTLWPVARPYPMVMTRYEERVGNLVFDPEGRWLATSTFNASGTVRLWHLKGKAPPPARIPYESQNHGYGIAASHDGNHILLGTNGKGVQLLSLGDELPRTLPNAPRWVWGVAFSADGRFVAANGKDSLRVWDISSNEEIAVWETGDVGNYSAFTIRFAGDGHLLSGGRAGLLRSDPETGDSEVLFEEPVDRFAISSDNARVLLSQAGGEMGTLSTLGRAALLDVETRRITPLISHGERITTVAMDDAGTLAVTGDENGVVRVGPITGEEPHLLLGSPGEIYDVAVDPRGRWIASSSGTEVRLWPMPDLSKPPLHTLPHAELIAKLKTLTNLRVVRDQDSSTGWKLEVGPFPGWETVPTW